MCGRMNVSDHAGIETLLDEVGMSLGERQFNPRFNVAPTANLLCIAQHDDQPSLVEMHWGLIPPWAKPGKFSGPIINARSESAREKPSFRKAIVDARIAIPANGFYEWRREGKDREAWYIAPREGSGLYFGGLSSISKEGELQACVLTTEANAAMADVHHRMPVILDSADVHTWLESDDTATIDSLMKPAGDILNLTPVTSFVNNARNDGPRCIEPA